MRMSFRNLLVALTGLLLLLGVSATAAVPSTALIEGTLHATSGGAAADGNYTAVFAIYKDQSGGAAVWVEGPVTLKVAGGQFSHAMGAVTPLKAGDLATGSWLAMKIGQDPELARRPLHSTAFALRAAVSESLACSGCISTEQLDPAVLKDYLKTGDFAKVAMSGAFADLVGAPDLSTYAKASSLADVATTGAYSDLSGAPDLSTYAKSASLGKVATSNKYADLTDKPVLAAVGKSCGTGLLVAGIKADGALDCVVAVGATGELPKDGIDEISNGLIWNQITDVFALKAPLGIPDNNPLGGFAEILVGDVGLVQKLTVTLELSNSDLSTVQVSMYDAANQEYVLYNKGGKKGDGIKTSYPDETNTISGDLTSWIGKNPKGTWRLKVIDSAFLNNTNDGEVKTWSVNMQTLSSNRIQIKGNLIVDGEITNAALDAKVNDKVDAKLAALTKVWPTLRWGRFSSYDQNWGNWFYSNGAGYTLGVTPSNWTDGSARVWSVSADKALWRSVLVNHQRVSPTMVVMSESWYEVGSTNGKVLVVLFRVKNATANAINWTPAFFHTNYGSWGECSSATLNGQATWENCSNCYAGNCQSQATFAVPANRTSSIMFAITNSPSSNMRTQLLTFISDTLKLPAGLEFVDDLETAENGWDK